MNEVAEVQREVLSDMLGEEVWERVMSRADRDAVAVRYLCASLMRMNATGMLDDEISAVLGMERPELREAYGASASFPLWGRRARLLRNAHKEASLIGAWFSRPVDEQDLLDAWKEMTP